MSLRDWLILIGLLIIVGILADGYRRMRLAKKRSSELSFGLEEVKGYDEEFSSELPNGGARSRMAEEMSATKKEATKERREPGFSNAAHSEDRALDARLENARQLQQEKAASYSEEQRQLDLDEPVPVLMNLDSPTHASVHVPQEPGADDAAKTVTQSHEADDLQNPQKELNLGGIPQEQPEKLKDRPPASEVIVINVLAKGGHNFAGEQLMQSMLASGMRFGDMSIFHRYANTNGTGKILFSMANGIKPGTFTIDNLEATETSALSLFMSLPGPEKPLQAFRLMEETAHRLALDLGGELKDEHFSVMTQQTLEHCRQRIREYERKQLARHPAH